MSNRRGCKADLLKHLGIGKDLAQGSSSDEALQQAIRDFLTEYRRKHDAAAPAVGTITLIYDHDVRGLEARLTDIQHHEPDLITTSMHSHLDANHCLLVIVVKGTGGRIQELARLLKGLRGVAQLRLTSLMATEASPHEHDRS